MQGKSDEAAGVNAKMSKVIKEAMGIQGNRGREEGDWVKEEKYNNKSADLATLAQLRIL